MADVAGRTPYYAPRPPAAAGPNGVTAARGDCIRSNVMAEVRDSNGTVLADGDAVMVIKDLKVKGTSVTLKRFTVIKNIRLTDDEENV